MTDALKAHADETRATFDRVAGGLQWTTGDRLRKIRRSVGFTQPAFAKALGVNLKSLSAWEADINTPRGLVAIAKRIELAFGVPAAWTLGLDEPTGASPFDGGPATGHARTDVSPLRLVAA